MFRLVPPAGAPIGIADLIDSCLGRFNSDLENQLKRMLSELLSVKHVFFVNSGRNAQTLILKALKTLDHSQRDEIIVPAYTCYSVAASVVRAGLKARPVDVDPETFDYDYSKLKNVNLEKVLAINVSNLFGILSDFDRLYSIADANNISIIDDAAQSFGLKFDDKFSGTLGRAGFYSLDRGKNLSTFSGGILVTDDDRIAELIEVESEKFVQPGIISDLINAVKISIVSLLSNPWLFRIPSALPFLGIGETIYDDDFTQAKLSRLQMALLKKQLPKLAVYNSSRRAHAEKFLNYFKGKENYFIPEGKVNRASLRFPVLAKNKNARDQIIEKLNKNGITASRMYPDIIANIDQIKKSLVSDPNDFCGAKEIVERMFTLPTHPGVSEKDVKIIISCLD